MVLTYCLMIFGPLLLFLLLNLLAVGITRKSFGVCIGPVMLSSALILFFGQTFFGTFTYATWLLVILAAAGPVLLAFAKDRKSIRPLYFSKGFWAFAAIYVIWLVACANAHVQEWDEYAHWAPMTVEMFHTDRFYNVSYARVFEHKEYPPFAQLFQYVWIRFSGKYTDSGLYTALRVLEYSLIIPFAVDKKDSKIKSSVSAIVLFFIAVVCLATYDHDGLLVQIRPDFLMAVMFGMSLYIIYRYDVYKDKLIWLYLSVLMMALATVKQVGIVFVAICALFTLCRFVITIKERSRIADPIKFAAIVVLPLVVRKMWTRSCLAEGVSGGQFAYREKGLGNMISEIFGIMSGNVTGDRADTFYDFVHEVFIRGLGNALVRPSFVACIALAVLALSIITVISQKSFAAGSDKRIVTALAIVIVIGSIVYTSVILITNLFFFSGSEMTSLASFDRYMSTYLVAVMIVVGSIGWDLACDVSDSVASPCMTALILLGAVVVFGANGLYDLMPRAFKQDKTGIYREYADFIDSSTDGGSSVFVADGDMESPVYLAYLLGNRNVIADRTYANMLEVSSDDSEMIGRYTQKLSECDYLFVAQKSGSMDEAFAGINNGEAFKQGGLYRINKNDGGIVLDIVDSF